MRPWAFSRYYETPECVLTMFGNLIFMVPLF